MKDNNLLIVEKYNEFFKYTYNVAQNIPRRHGILKQEFIKLLLDTIQLVYKAVKTNQKSKLYELDGNLATIRFYMRTLSETKENRNLRGSKFLISRKNNQHSELLLSEVGKILGSWLSKLN